MYYKQVMVLWEDEYPLFDKQENMVMYINPLWCSFIKCLQKKDRTTSTQRVEKTNTHKNSWKPRIAQDNRRSNNATRTVVNRLLYKCPSRGLFHSSTNVTDCARHGRTRESWQFMGLFNMKTWLLMFTHHVIEVLLYKYGLRCRAAWLPVIVPGALYKWHAREGNTVSEISLSF